MTFYSISLLRSLSPLVDSIGVFWSAKVESSLPVGNERDEDERDVTAMRERPVLEVQGVRRKST